MKAKKFIDLAASGSVSLLNGLTIVAISFSLMLFPFVVGPVTGIDPGSQVFAGDGGGKPDNPGGGGGGGSGGKPENPGGGGGKPDKPGRGKGDLYSDLVVTYRDLDGLPYFVGVPEGEEEPEELIASPARLVKAAAAAVPAGFVACEQPLMVEDASDVVNDYADSTLLLYDLFLLSNPLTNDADGNSYSPVPLGGAGWAGEECDLMANPDFSEDVLEVHFGRLNVGRAPIKTLSQQLRDVTGVLKSADTLSFDHGPRITAGELTVDSPLQNLAIHRELMIRDSLGEGIDLADLPWTDDDTLHYAAAALGAAADKGLFDEAGLVNLDLVVFNNRILDIPNQTTVFGQIEGDGVVGVEDRLYFDFSGFDYDRAATYPGCAIGIDYFPLPAETFNVKIMEMVFSGQPFTGSNVFGFATAADDARRVISYAHATEDFAVLSIDKAGESELCQEE